MPKNKTESFNAETDKDAIANSLNLDHIVLAWKAVVGLTVFIATLLWWGITNYIDAQHYRDMNQILSESRLYLERVCSQPLPEQPAIRQRRQ